MRNPDFLYLVIKHLLDPLHETFELLFRLFLLGLVFLRGNLVQIQLTLGHGLEVLAVEFVEMTHQPLVDTLAHQQHLNTLLAKYLQVRTIAGRSKTVRSNVIDLVLAFLHTHAVVSE